MLPDAILKRPSAYRYVNHMLNICYLTGFARDPDAKAGVFMLQQNNNRAQAMPITVSPGERLPRDKTPVTVLCHLFGARNEDGESNLVIKAIDIQKPSVRSMPALTTWVKGTSKGSLQDEFRPFSADPSVYNNTHSDTNATSGTEFNDSEQILRDILDATRGRLDTRLGDNANVVLLAGFIDAMAYVNGNEHQKNGYGALLIRQHEDPDRSIPVRLYSNSAHSILKQVAPGMPISVAGQVRMKILPNDDGLVRHTSLHVRVPDLYRADRKKDIVEIPDWWASIRDRIVAERQARRTAMPQPSPQRDTESAVVEGL